MWPFTKTSRVPASLPLEDSWSILQGVHNGWEMIVRVNGGYKKFGRIAGYEHQVGIAVPFHAPEATGLPSPRENSDLHAIEKVLSTEFEQQAECLLVAVITTGGMREFVFYARDPEWVRRRFEFLRKRITTHEIQLMIQADKRWKVYAQGRLIWH